MRKIYRILCACICTLLFFGNTLPLYAETPPPPEVNSVYVYMMDADTGEELCSIEGNTRMYPASMTKVLTAIIAIEELPDLQETFCLTEESFSNLVEIGASMAGFGLYDSPTLEDLLYGLMLPSGAECAEGLAIAVSGSTEAFVEEMNRKAQSLGMHDSHFMNPSGLHEDDHYTTCHDLALLVQYCRSNPTFMKIYAALKHTSIPVVTSPQGLEMHKTFSDQIYKDLPGFEGGKTGYTPDAGRCMASSANIGEMNLILVTGLSGYQDGPTVDAELLYRWADDAYDVLNIVTSGVFLTSIPVSDAKDGTEEIRFSTEETIRKRMSSDTSLTVESEFVDEIIAPMEAGTVLGRYTVKDGDTVLYEKVYILDHDIEQTTSAMIRDFVTGHPIVVIFYGIAAVFLIFFLAQLILHNM